MINTALPETALSRIKKSPNRKKRKRMFGLMEQIQATDNIVYVVKK